MSRRKVLVAVSGGVDSAVATKILIDEGYDVSGIFLDLWREPGSNKHCPLEARRDAQKLCSDLSIPFYTLDFSNKFKEEVVDNFLEEYGAGRTPNPCVVCNKKIKIGALINYALSNGFDYLATGHYVSVLKDGDDFRLFKGADKDKDQSYFLYNLQQDQLKHLLFPLGSWKKNDLRKFAIKSNIEVASKADSQEICFIAGKRHNDFLKKHLKLNGGDIVLHPSGEVLDKHDGLQLYTIGQRRGVNIGGTGPYYAAKFDFDKNILYVVKNFDDSILYHKEMFLRDVSWVNEKNIKLPLKTKVVIRYRHKAVFCVLDYEKSKKQYFVRFSRKQRAVTPGQSAVFYNDKEVLGGGIIC